MRRIALAIAALLAAASAQAQPKAEAVLRKEAGNDYLKQRKYAQARDEYLAALKLDPTYEDAHYNLGVVYFFRLQDYPRALYHLTTYARMNREAPDMAQVKSLVAQALEKIEEPEREDYSRALAEGTAAAVRAFIETHPTSSYLSDARLKLRLLEAYEEEVRQQGKAEEAAYADAVAKGTSAALDAFLAAHPGAAQAAEARGRRDRLADDEKALQAAVAVGTPEALERFASEHPESPLAAQARAKLDDLRAQADRRAKEEAEARATEAEARAREAEARAREAEAAARAAAEAAWAAAEKADTAEAFDLFATAYPNHPRAAEARARSIALRAGETAAPASGASPPAAAGSSSPAPEPPPAAAGSSSPAPEPPPAAAESSSPAPEPPPAAAESSSPAPEPPPPADPEAQLASEWQEVQRIDTEEAYRTFLQRHPQGEEAEAARKRVEELSSPAVEGGGRRKTLDRYRKMIQGK